MPRLKARLRAGSTARAQVQAVFRRPVGRLHAAAAGAGWGLCFGPVGQCFATNAAPHWPPLPTHRPQREASAPRKSTPRPHPARRAKTERRCVPPSPPLLSKWGQDGPLFAPRKERERKRNCALRKLNFSGPPAKGNEGNARPRGGETPQPTRRQGQGKRLCWRARKSGPPRLRPCLRAVWGVGENVAGVPPCGGSPAHLSPVSGVFLCLVSRVVCLSLGVSGGLSVGLVVCLAGRCPAPTGRRGPLPLRRLLLAWNAPQSLPAVFGRLVRLWAAWPLCVVRRKKSPAR